MAIHRQHSMDVDDATLDQLRGPVGMSRQDAHALVKQEGLDGLRIRVAATLYAAEYLTSGEAADRVIPLIPRRRTDGRECYGSGIESVTLWEEGSFEPDPGNPAVRNFRELRLGSSRNTC